MAVDAGCCDATCAEYDKSFTELVRVGEELPPDL